MYSTVTCSVFRAQNLWSKMMNTAAPSLMLSRSDFSVFRRVNSDMLETTGAKPSSSSLNFLLVLRKWSLK